MTRSAREFFLAKSKNSPPRASRATTSTSAPSRPDEAASENFIPQADRISALPLSEPKSAQRAPAGAGVWAKDFISTLSRDSGRPSADAESSIKYSASLPVFGSPNFIGIFPISAGASFIVSEPRAISPPAPEALHEIFAEISRRVSFITAAILDTFSPSKKFADWSTGSLSVPPMNALKGSSAPLRASRAWRGFSGSNSARYGIFIESGCTPEVLKSDCSALYSFASYQSRGSDCVRYR